MATEGQPPSAPDDERERLNKRQRTGEKNPKKEAKAKRKPAREPVEPSEKVLRMVGSAPGDVKGVIATKTKELRRLRGIRDPRPDDAIRAMEREIDEIKVVRF